MTTLLNQLCYLTTIDWCLRQNWFNPLCIYYIKENKIEWWMELWTRMGMVAPNVASKVTLSTVVYCIDHMRLCLWNQDGGTCAGRLKRVSAEDGMSMLSSWTPKQTALTLERASSTCGREATRYTGNYKERSITHQLLTQSKGPRVKCWLWKLVKLWFSSITAFLLPHEGVHSLLPRDLTWSPAGQFYQSLNRCSIP